MSPLPEVGYLCAALALGGAVHGAVASAVGSHWRDAGLVESGRRGLFASALLSTAAVLVLVHAFLTHDFSLSYVWQTSSRTTPSLYLLAGLWGGQAGSLLFWSWLLAVLASVAAARAGRADAALVPWFTAVVAAVVGFFQFLVVFVASPFERLAVLPADGNGLNPLLQHPGMAFHPPALYLGFTGMAIPFAFAMSALIARRTDPGWIRASRRWLLVAWLFLSVGLALGGRWAYDVLGWGGYWGWDPVENAALMPWLAATAFLHSVIVEERRGMFRVWNMALVILVFSLTIVGTFLTRAGLVSSVHAFAQSEVGPYFLAFTAATILGSLALLWWRLPSLRTHTPLAGALSRESAFLANNVLFMGALFAVFWGTLFPLVSEVLGAQRVTVGAPYFNSVAVPILWLIVLWMAVGPLSTWGRTDPRRLWRAMLPSFVVSLAIAAALFLAGIRAPAALAGLTAAALALVAAVAEIARGIAARMHRGEGPARAAGRLFARNRRRYGGYVVHIGVALLAIGVVGSNLYDVEAEEVLGPGESLVVGGYTLTHAGLGQLDEPDRTVVFAELAVARDGRQLAVVRPRREFFRLREDQPITVPAIRHRPLDDVYTLLAAVDPETERITVKALVVPLVGFVWLGMLVLVAGTVVAAWPDPAETRVLDAEVRRLLAGAGSTS